MEKLCIKPDALKSGEMKRFLEDHLSDMRSVSPPESSHALDWEELRRPNVHFYSAWIGNELVGCGAIQALDANHGEIKSMRVAEAWRNDGFGAQILTHLLDVAYTLGLKRLSLETGSMAFFQPARRLYERFGFNYCPPFSKYVEDPNSVFMTKELNT